MGVSHWIQLVTYKYNREALFCQTGETSQLSNNLDALTQTFGILMERQSERNIPRTKYADGIRGGRFQAHEMTGVMLLLVLTLRSRAGRNLLLLKARGAQKEFFQSEQQVKNWIRMLETHLMFETWLGKEEHEVDLLRRAETKVKELMSLTKHLGQRSKGMGYNLESFHTTVHMPKLAMELCAPVHWSTESNESHHKIDKKTAKQTARHFDTFNISVVIKDVYRTAVELGMEEIHNGCKRWLYFRRGEDKPIAEPEYFEPTLTGPSISWDWDEEINMFKETVFTKMTGKENFQYDPNTMGFIRSLASDLHTDNGVERVRAFGTLKMFSPEAENNCQPFHAMPYYRGKPWNDWAMFDLSDPDSETPTAGTFVAAQIKCFLDFRTLPKANATLNEPGIMAIIEPAHPNINSEEKWWSSLFDPIKKKPCTVQGYEGDNAQELVPIHRLTHPALVVPDIDNPNKRAYLRMVARKVWPAMFDIWLEEPHEKEFE